MIPAQAAVQARHLHADGWTVSAIARHLGHDRKTVRIYLAGVRDPGQPRAGTTDTFGPFDAYATRRLRQDPHLSAAALHRELLGLDYAGSYSAFTRSLRQRGLLTECPDCSNDTVPRITQRASLLNHLHRPQGLPIRVAPVFGQTIASFLDQVAVANHLPAAALLAHLPAWFRQQYRTHDDLNPGKGPRAHRQDADALAALTRNDADALAKTLPALAGRHRDPSTPMRLTVACHRCTARRGLPAVIPVHLPALQRLCPRHRTWLGHTQQIDTTGCPDIVGAARRAARLARRHGSTRVLLAETIARQTIQQCLAHDQYPVVTQRWSVRIDRLATARTRSLSGTGPHAREDLIAAATYSDTITLAASLLSPTGSDDPPDHCRSRPLARLLGSLPLTPARSLDRRITFDDRRSPGRSPLNLIRPAQRPEPGPTQMAPDRPAGASPDRPPTRKVFVSRTRRHRSERSPRRRSEGPTVPARWLVRWPMPACVPGTGRALKRQMYGRAGFALLRQRILLS